MLTGHYFRVQVLKVKVELKIHSSLLPYMLFLCIGILFNKHNYLSSYNQLKFCIMKEKIVRRIIEVAFVIRYWALLILLGALVYITWYVAALPGVLVRDTVAVFTGGAVVITLFYHILNYEYSQRKFKHEIKASKDMVSFNTAMEWQKEYMNKNNNILHAFFVKHKTLLQDGLNRQFQEELEKPENDENYGAFLAVINFMESVCLGVKQGIMDEGFIKGFFRSTFKDTYITYKKYIEFRRDLKHNPKIWNNFTELCEKWITCDTN